jgi:predicted metalloprotease with PDZ domain
MLLCLVFFSLLSVAQSEQLRYDTTGENWSLGNSDEGGSGSSYMGVDIADVTAERLGDLKLKEENGAEITMVDQDAPAGKAGLHEHDVILSLNGTTVESAAQLRRMIKEIPPGRVVTLGISRDSQPLTIKLQLADRRKSMAYKPNAPEFNFKMPEMPVIPDFEGPLSVVITHSSVRSGLMVENITPQLGEFFGIKNGKGVLVRSVEKGSKAEKAGFRAGDVVVKVNDQAIRDTSDFTHALRSSSGASAAVTVVREKKEQNLNLALPPKRDSGSLIEDSFDIDVPDFSAETEVQLGRLGDEMARIRPALEKVQRQIQSKDFQKKLRDSQRTVQELQEKLSHELCGEWAQL